jgi:hypothetical protein
VSVYERITQRYPNVKGEDYLFFPAYTNRETASRIVQRQFNTALSVRASSTILSRTPRTPSIRCVTPPFVCVSSYPKVRCACILR